MSDKYLKLIDALKKGVNPAPATPIVPVEVVVITGETCTVKYGDLELTDVRLKATENGSVNSVLLLPKVGSMVLVGSLTGDMNDLVVLKIDELEKLAYKQDDLEVAVDATDGKVSVKNDEVSLVDLFQQLADLLKTLKVFTPSGPSGVPIPTSMNKIVAWETDFKKLLK